MPSLRRTRRNSSSGTPPETTFYAPEPEYGDDDDDAGRFAPNRSPFVMAPASAQLDPYAETASAPASFREALAGPPYDDDDDEFDEDGGYLPPNQVDFFAPDTPLNAAVPIRRFSAAPDPDLPAVKVLHSVAEITDASQSPLTTVTASTPAPELEAPIDPNDIMAFFDKATVTSQLPETLRSGVEVVSAAELLDEARQISSLLKGRQASA